jgi:hypothetical protein
MNRRAGAQPAEERRILSRWHDSGRVGMIRVPLATKEQPMPTRIVFVAPGVRGGVLTQVFVEEPDQVFETLTGSGGLPFKLTARTSREEAVYVNPATIAYWTLFAPSRARANEQAA